MGWTSRLKVAAGLFLRNSYSIDRIDQGTISWILEKNTPMQPPGFQDSTLSGQRAQLSRRQYSARHIGMIINICRM